MSRLRRGWTPPAVIYLLLAVAGLVGTWTYNVRAVLESVDFLGDLAGGGPAVSSITTDLLVVAIAAVAFMLAEGRRIGMKRVWILVLLAPLVALAFAFPLFLALRERHLTLAREP
jgi:phosphate/sulfate permease